MSEAETAQTASHEFQADVRQILELVTHSLYSDREIFLRELVSNASDALDRARFEKLSDDALRDAEPPADLPAGIRITVSEADRTIVIEDDGIGLTAEEAADHLGTIAKSGTRAFREALEAQKDAGGHPADGFIGRFGVGFYSAFMVADRVVVDSLSARPGAAPIRWESDGGSGYTLEAGDRAARGTTITLHVRDDADDFLDEERLRGIVRKHSDFVPWPVFVGEGRANQDQALWRRDPADVSDDEYKALYRHLTGDWQEPLAWVHTRAEGGVSYDAILFIPKSRPWTMDRLDFEVQLKLYQKRVKVLDHATQLLPRHLRWVAGVVDSPDVELNMSREMLQTTPALTAIKKNLTKKVLDRLKDLSVEQAEDYVQFWTQLGHILKEGIAEAAMGGSEKDKKRIVPLLRFTTTKSRQSADVVDRWRSLAQVKADMVEGQDAIWYLADVDKDRIAKSPLLEAFKKKDQEVLLMDDPVDEWVAMHVPEFDEVPLKSVAHGDLDEEEEQREEEDPIAKAAKDQARPLVGWMEALLGEDVAGVRVSNRLVDSPSVLVSEEGAMSANMERILQAANQDVPTRKRVLEVNPEHPMVKTLARLHEDGKTGLEPFARLLLDHAAISEGKLDDPEGFATRLQALMEKAASAM
ncbi:MAG: molecular chaperone HtpG [Alphaproteobacteria bacterium]|nr:molecular chaperone HtpG [Alphaproteobacteria bacterium]